MPAKGEGYKRLNSQISIEKISQISIEKFVQRSGFNRIGWRFLGLNSSAVGRPFFVRLCRQLWQVPIYRSAEFRGEL
jgi:hypothetical protein